MPSEPSIVVKGRRQADATAAVHAGNRRRQLLIDLAQRADEGIFIHLPAWMLVGGSAGLASSSTRFYWLNASIFFVNMLLRLLLRRRFAVLAERRPALATAAYLTLLFGNALHWGLLSAAAVGWEPLADARLALWFTTTAIAASGSMALSIMPLVRLCYPIATLAPITVAMLVQHERQSFFFPVALTGFFAYIFRASGAVQRDYRTAADLRFELEQRARDLELLSTVDSLTQIKNRHYFDHRLITEWTLAAREQRPLTVLMIDVDHFKRINDAHGHAFGDLCLQTIARELQAALRHPNDTLGRYGGEEFAALLPGTSGPAAMAVAERMRRRVAAVVLQQGGLPVPLACSIGLFTVLPSPHEIASKAVEQADRALYAAKAQGRNRVVVGAGSHP